MSCDMLQDMAIQLHWEDYAKAALFYIFIFSFTIISVWACLIDNNDKSFEQEIKLKPFLRSWSGFFFCFILFRFLC